MPNFNIHVIKAVFALCFYLEPCALRLEPDFIIYKYPHDNISISGESTAIVQAVRGLLFQ